MQQFLHRIDDLSEISHPLFAMSLSIYTISTNKIVQEEQKIHFWLVLDINGSVECAGHEIEPQSGYAENQIFAGWKNELYQSLWRKFLLNYAEIYYIM